ncbi:MULTISPECIES: LLM class F420-dependent oxidoreductase [Streptomyces]|uniref:LLM class F420-dependent oxidoreductase n=1 Tax=Streptomyces TaxID=1883 RepID=UPI0023BA1861|nr:MULTISPECIES: LLM class F420-dependent oxidoreductase [unclassified Streptomyces]MDT0424204.1 LLM class F420-dependent oxidoreductase [Streptomyces sp. DSM 41859]WEH25948.1 LLM class F420-dependent oxidoreductase [Streptomyces sp. AM 3-1-1]
MPRIGYTLMTEQAGPRELVAHAVGAEEAGFDFSVMSDHYFPWLREQGHAPYAWSVLGAVAQATERLPLMTYVTCPTVRYHPAVIAQKAATVQLLSQGRFRLGLGSGENLNEHVVGRGWPAARVRIEMLEEAVGIIRALLDGETVHHDGKHFSVQDAKLWDLPETAPPIGVAVSGPRSCALAGRLADLVIATEPKAQLLADFDRFGGTGKPRVGQLPVSYDPDREAALTRAHEQFRWSLGPWPVNAELPGPVSFDGATSSVTREDVAAAIPCGDDVDAFVEAVRAYADAGFDEIALIQVGGAHQEPFLRWARERLLPALRSL